MKKQGDLFKATAAGTRRSRCHDQRPVPGSTRGDSVSVVFYAGNVSGLTSNDSLYRYCDKWTEPDKFSLKIELTPLLFATLPVYATMALNIFLLKLSQLKKTELDKDGNVVMRSDSQLALTPLYRTRLLLLSATR